MRCEFRYSLCLVFEDLGLRGCKMGKCPKYSATTYSISAGACVDIAALVGKLQPAHPPCH